MIVLPLSAEQKLQLETAALEFIEAWVEHLYLPKHSAYHNTVLRWAEARERMCKIFYPDYPKRSEHYKPAYPASQVDPRQIIEASRVLAAKSRDQYATPLWNVLAPLPVKRSEKDKMFVAEMKNRMDLVMDCFNTGAAMMLKLLHGDSEPEPWSEDYDHEARLRELLNKYGCLGEPSQGAEISEPVSTTGTQTKGE